MALTRSPGVWLGLGGVHVPALFEARLLARPDDAGKAGELHGGLAEGGQLLRRLLGRLLRGRGGVHHALLVVEQRHQQDQGQPDQGDQGDAQGDHEGGGVGGALGDGYQIAIVRFAEPRVIGLVAVAQEAVAVGPELVGVVAEVLHGFADVAEAGGGADGVLLLVHSERGRRQADGHVGQHAVQAQRLGQVIPEGGIDADLDKAVGQVVRVAQAYADQLAARAGDLVRHGLLDDVVRALQQGPEGIGGSGGVFAELEMIVGGVGDEHLPIPVIDVDVLNPEIFAQLRQVIAGDVFLALGFDVVPGDAALDQVLLVEPAVDPLLGILEGFQGGHAGIGVALHGVQVVGDAVEHLDIPAHAEYADRQHQAVGYELPAQVLAVLFVPVQHQGDVVDEQPQHGAGDHADEYRPGHVQQVFPHVDAADDVVIAVGHDGAEEHGAQGRGQLDLFAVAGEEDQAPKPDVPGFAFAGKVAQVEVGNALVVHDAGGQGAFLGVDDVAADDRADHQRLSDLALVGMGDDLAGILHDDGDQAVVANGQARDALRDIVALQDILGGPAVGEGIRGQCDVHLLRLFAALGQQRVGSEQRSLVGLQRRQQLRDLYVGALDLRVDGLEKALVEGGQRTRSGRR